jgi:hypothetical protein
VRRIKLTEESVLEVVADIDLASELTRAQKAIQMLLKNL